MMWKTYRTNYEPYGDCLQVDTEKTYEQLKKHGVSPYKTTINMLFSRLFNFCSNKYTCNCGYSAYSYGSSHRVVTFAQGKHDCAGQNQNSDKSEYDAQICNSDSMLSRRNIHIVSMVHFFFGHADNAFRRTWNYLVVFCQRFRLRQRTGIMLLLNLDLLEVFSMVCISRRHCVYLDLCYTNRAPYCLSRFVFGVACAIPLSGCFPMQRNTICCLKMC